MKKFLFLAFSFLIFESITFYSHIVQASSPESRANGGGGGVGGGGFKATSETDLDNKTGGFK